jgi:hypothetical protein
MFTIHRLVARLPVGPGDESGDVPGWVLITAMTVSLVLLVWGVTSSALRGILDRFLNDLSFGG